ncbi:heparin lyase I family protein [Alphaproteobacteria bacterium]|nr:heparin lyase I family protein [Alphaproteobacteria bacterium]
MSSFGVTKLVITFVFALMVSASAWGGNWNNDEIKPGTNSGFDKFKQHGSKWKPYNHSILKNSNEARKGRKYQRIELRGGDCFPWGSWNDCKTDRNRLEFLALPKQAARGNHCYSLSLKLDPSFKAVYPTSTSLAQIKQTDGPKGSYLGFPSSPPILMFTANRKKLQFEWHQLFGDKKNVKTLKTKKNLANLADILGKWTDISWCLDFDKNKIQAWVNGEQKVDISDATFKWKPKSIFMKYGIYNTHVSAYKKTWDEPMPTLIVNYDEVRRGTSIEQVDANINTNLQPVD